MAYLSLYRHLRPQRFGALVGQEHVTRTLKEALRQKRISHAYLFAGPRGTGKTSTARILAKALNCAEGVQEEPCNQCPPCQEIAAGTFLDVLEIDGASNRGVDEIRDLREKVKFSPASGRYKIYIIDEVHMLTTEAFNALLKTLEEPPAHVIFILATTEPQKVLPTVVSRCQRFEFRRLESETIVSYLKEAALSLEIEGEEEAFYQIARAATGALRDALSILEQCLVFAGKGKLSRENVEAVLGIPGEEWIFSLGEALAGHNVEAVLELVARAVREGRELRYLGLEVESHLRNLLICLLSPTALRLLEVSPTTAARLKEQAQKFSPEELFQMISWLQQATAEMRGSIQPRITLELALIKAATREKEISLSALEERVRALENSLSGLPQVAFTVQTKTKPSSPPLCPAEPETSFSLTSKAREGDQPPHPGQIRPSLPALTFEVLKARWPEVLEVLKGQVALKAWLSCAEPWQLEGETLFLRFAVNYTFHKERVEEPASRDQIERALKKVFGRELKIRCLLAEGEPAAEAAEKSLPAEEEGESLYEMAREVFQGSPVEASEVELEFNQEGGIWNGENAAAGSENASPVAQSAGRSRQ